MNLVCCYSSILSIIIVETTRYSVKNSLSTVAQVFNQLVNVIHPFPACIHHKYTKLHSDILIRDKGGGSQDE